MVFSQFKLKKNTFNKIISNFFFSNVIKNLNLKTLNRSTASPSETDIAPYILHLAIPPEHYLTQHYQLQQQQQQLQEFDQSKPVLFKIDCSTILETLNKWRSPLPERRLVN